MELFFSKDFSNTVNKLNIEIAEGAYVYGDSDWSFSSVNSPYTRVYYFESGEAHVLTSNGKIPLTEGNVYIIPPGTTCTGECSGSFSKLYFHVNIKRPDGYDLLLGLNQVYSFNVGKEHIKKIKEYFFTDSLVNILRCKNDILSFCLSIFPSELVRKLVTTVYSNQVQNAIDYINNNISIQLSVKLLSEKLFTAPTTLAKHFHDEVGINIGQYIDDIVFDSAKKQLMQDDLPIQVISDRLGFCDRFYFSRRFKEKFGLTPYKYRKLNTKGE